LKYAFSMKSSEGFTRLIPGLLTVATGMAVLDDSAAPLSVRCIALVLAGVIGFKLISES
jgi:quaternary ammonium compound-resistance protein SugE